MTQLRITTESGDGWHRVAPAGELDIAVADQLRAVIVEIAGSTVVVDLSGVTFIDASGIGALVDARQKLEAGGNRLELRGAQGIVRRVFELAGLEDWLNDEPGPPGRGAPGRFLGGEHRSWALGAGGASCTQCDCRMDYRMVVRLVVRSTSQAEAWSCDLG